MNTTKRCVRLWPECQPLARMSVRNIMHQVNTKARKCTHTNALTNTCQKKIDVLSSDHLAIIEVKVCSSWKASQPNMQALQSRIYYLYSQKQQ